MTTLRASFDADMWRWSLLSGKPAGASGLASVALGAEVVAHVDYATGGLVEITVDARSSSGDLGDEARAVVELLGGPGAHLGGVLETSGRLDQVVGRLALLAEVAKDRNLLAPVSTWWELERWALESLLGLSSTGEGSGTHPVEPIALPDDPSWSRRLDRVLTLVDRVDVGRADPGDEEIELTDIIDEGQSRLGQLDPAQADHITVDASTVPAGRLDLRAGLTVDFDRAGSQLALTTMVQPGLYAGDVQQVVATVIDEAADVIVAAAPFGLAPGVAPRGAPVARAELVLNGGRDLSALSFHLSDANALTVPSAQLRARRRLQAAARLSVLRERLRATPGDELWEG